ncbi:tetratricopeptide repeat protein [Candidatus Peribacteria bacterium]|nr:tetratricopeptide repeat protein [Candidatus Peribacteria bacterium]
MAPSASPAPIRYAWHRLLMMLGAIVPIVIFLYARAADYPFVVWDDGLLIYDNPAIRAISFSTLRTIFTTYDPELYIPLTLFSYQIDYLIGGSNPGIYHVQNILWHFLNSLLVTVLLSMILSGSHRGTSHDRSWKMALMLGALFAAHPMHVETVVWASARKDLLSTFFGLLTTISWLHWQEDPRRRWLIAALVLFTAGLLSKVTIIGMPLILALLSFERHRRIDPQTLRALIAFLALSMTFGIVAALGKSEAITVLTPTMTLLMMAKGVAFTVAKWVVPLGLSVLYPYNGSVSLFSPEFFVPIIGLAGGSLALVAIARRTRSHAPWISGGIFLSGLLPSLLNFAKGGTMYVSSDRYAYFASIGLLLGIGYLLTSREKPQTQVRASGGWTVALCFVLVACIALSVRQVTTWSSNEALFRNVLQSYPESHVARNNIANILSKRALSEGDIVEAIEEYEGALAVHDSLPPSRSRELSRSKILSNLASALRQSGDSKGAYERYTAALKHYPQNAFALVGLGILSANAGDYREAMRMYHSALEAVPRFAPAYLNLGNAHLALGDLNGALDAFDAAIDASPLLPQPHFNRGVVLQKLGNLSLAKSAYRKAIYLAPGFVAARINLGILQANGGEISEAREQFADVLRYDPDNERAKHALEQIDAL